MECSNRTLTILSCAIDVFVVVERPFEDEHLFQLIVAVGFREGSWQNLHEHRSLTGSLILKDWFY